MRRFLLPFVLMFALAGVVAAPAASAAPATTSDLGTLTVTGDVGQKPTIAVTEAHRGDHHQVEDPGEGQR